jgi:hypothetical protein
VTPSATVVIALLVGGCAVPNDPAVQSAAPRDVAAPEVIEETGPPALPALPDVSSRAIGIDDLLAMLPAEGPAASTAPTTTAERSNAVLVSGATADREDEARDVQRFGRRSGVFAEYPQGDGSAYVWIDLLDDHEAAHGYLADVAGDIAKGVGGTHEPGALAGSASEFPVDTVGDEAIGLEVTLAGGEPETIVLFRMGRLVVFSSVTGPAGADRRVPALYLSEEVQGRIADVLVESFGPNAPAAGPESYRFSFEQHATIDTAVHTTSAEGVVDGSSVSCRVRMDAPGLSLDRDLVLVGSTLWSRDHGANDYRLAGGGNVADRTLLAYCPPWPVDLDQATLGAVTAGDAATHTLDGREVLGYRGDAGLLADALGIGRNGLDVEVFTVWIAAGTPWIVDLRLDASGPGDDLGRLVSPGIREDAVVRLLVSQELTAIGEAGPVRPPAMAG